MKKVSIWAGVLILALGLSACSTVGKLVDMQSVIVNDTAGVVWENRIYAPFCVVSKRDCGAQIGYIDGDKDHRISEYKGYAPEEWLVSWLPMDGGAMLLKEEHVIEIPDGLKQEYGLKEGELS